MRAVSAADSAIGGMPGGQGWPPRAGQRRAAGVNLQVIGIYSGQVRSAGGVLARGRGGAEDAGAAGEGGLDGGGPELGERGQRGMPADRVVCPGLGLVPAEGVLPGSESSFC
jgi:hypothetical protein